MDLIKIRDDIRNTLSEKRKSLNLEFSEDEHIYHMRDTDGKIKNTFPSVSKVVKKFYTPFDSDGISLRIAKGNLEEQKRILTSWNNAGKYSTNLGSRVHFELEKELIKRNKNYKNVREPIFECDDEQMRKSDKMIIAGHEFLNLMESRNGVLLDTELVLGDPELGYTGQPDKVWIIETKEKNDFGFLITDWKTNQPKNFEVQHYTDKMLYPFQGYPNTSLSHYYIQLPLYGRLLIKMLEGTKYDSKKLLGCIIVLLKDDATFTEYRTPQEINKKILNMDLKKYI